MVHVKECDLRVREISFSVSSSSFVLVLVLGVRDGRYWTRGGDAPPLAPRGRVTRDENEDEDEDDFPRPYGT